MKKLLVVTVLLLFVGIAIGQTLKKGCVLGVHHITNIVLAEGATMDDFIEFNLQTYIPAFEKALPGVKLFLVEGNRGEEQDNFGLLFYCESVKVRDQYWPEKDVTSEKANAALEIHLGPVMEEFDKIVTSTSSGQTDWTIL
jgi:hypothetical protein